MPLLGQTLKIGNKSEEVKILHSFLQQLGFGGVIPSEEINNRAYGKGTAEAVANFQEKNGLEPTGEVDKKTAKAINNAVEKLEPEPQPDTFIVRGYIRQPDNTPLPDLIVRAFDQAQQKSPIPLGQEAVTDTKGYYEIHYTEKDFDASNRNGAGPNLLIRAYAGETLLKESESTQNAKNDETIDLIVERKDSGQNKEQFKVSGTVFNSRQETLAGISVRVYDVDLRGAASAGSSDKIEQIDQSGGFEFLGEAKTDPKGFYEVAFTSEALARSEVGRADVIAYAIEDGKIVGRSKLIVGKDDQPLEIKDLNMALSETKERGASEYKELMGILQPILDTNKLRLHELNEPQAQFLSEETGKEIKFIQLLIASDKLRLELSNQPFKTDLFYSLGRQEISLTWAALALKNEDELKNALTRSIEQNIISEQSSNVIEDFIKFIKQHSIVKLLRETSLPEAKILTNTLKLALADENAETKFLAAASTFRDPDPQKFWEEHLPKAGLNSDQINSLQLVNQLYLLSDGHMPLVEELKQNNIDNPEELLQFSQSDWQNMVKRTGVPADTRGEKEEEKQSLFVENLQNQLNAAFPTQKIGLMINQNQLEIPDAAVKNHVQTFIQQNKDFDISNSRVQDFDNKIREIGNGKHEEVKASLMTLQRVYQVSPSPEVMTKLLNQNLTSAYQISGIPEQTFIQNYGELLGGEEAAWAVYQRAQHQVQRAQDTIITLNEMVNGVAPAATTFNAERERLRETLGRHIPNWEELFGNVDLCECRECRSVLSPAAYFVDLLQFLKKSNITPSTNILDEILLKRRPDLAHLELTCENTNTIVPYIDLVNEVLEHYVDFGHLDESAAYNIKNETAVELRANPQHTSVEAYRKLKDKVYPFTLPYHQPLDVIRTYLAQIGTSRSEIITHLGRETDPSHLNNALNAEYLNLSPEEFAVLTGLNFDNSANRLEDWRYFGYHDQTVFAANRCQVPELLKRAELKYVELIELLKTRFLNPAQTTLAYLEDIFTAERILPNELYAKLQRIKDNILDVDSDSELVAALNRRGISPAVFKSWVHEHFDALKQVVTLFEPNSNCDLATTSLRTIQSIYESSPEPGSFDGFFSKFHRFVRLWRKTGWSIAELDTLLTALGAPDVTPQVLAQVADVKKIQAQTGLSPAHIAVLWGNIETNWAHSSLYARLFLNKSVRPANQAFEPNSRGEYLEDPNQMIAGNSLALLAAFRINSAELDLIIQDLAVNPTKEQLSLAAVSQIYRYVVLAKALKIQIADLIQTKQIFANHPFSRWDGSQFVDLDTRKTLTFIELAIKIKDSGFKPILLKYLFSGEASEKNISLNEEKILQIVRQVRADLLVIETDYPEAANTIVSEEFLRPKMQLIFDPAAVDELFGIINGNLRYGTRTLPNLELAIPEYLKAKTSYRKATGRLEFQGVMTDAEKTILQGLDPSENYKSAINQLYEQPAKFFAQSFSHIFREESALNEAVSRLITRTTPGLSEAEKLTFFYQSYLPFLKEQLQNNAVLLPLSSLINLTLPQTAALIGSKISDLVKFFIPQGLTGKYFNTTDFTGDATERTDAAINFTWSAPPIGTITGPGYSVRWEGYVCPDQTAEYTFVVEVPEADDSFKLQIDDEAIEKSAGNSVLSWELPKSLQAGKTYFIKLEYAQRTGTGGVQVFWQTDNLPSTPITSLNLYPAQETMAIQNKAGEYHRAANLITKFELTELEIAYLTARAAQFGNLDLTALTPQMWLRIYDYVTLRKQTNIAGEAWILFFNAAQTATWETLKNWLSANIGWSLADLKYLKTHFGLTERDFRNEEKLVNLLKVFELTRKTGLMAQNLADWASVSTNFDQLEEIAQSVKQTVRAKYEADEWLIVAAQLSDKIRERQKQALISALLVNSDYRDLRASNVNDANGLFEYFLIDVQMTHCMDTSRLKQAISSVQSLVTRCLLNLESGVSPSKIDATKWAWMKNYRVWEAARKIFLFPENWLEPEWRDDRTPFFKELESELQQNDITGLTVETALRNYLFKLNEVSHLNVLGVHEHLESETLHVFARTFHPPYQYFYRTRDKFKHWSGWEKVPLDIRGYEDSQDVSGNPDAQDGSNSGVHLVPIVWKNRLLLFWTEFTLKTRENRSNQGTSIEGLRTQTQDQLRAEQYYEVRLAWSEYRDRKWTPKQLSDRFAVTDGTPHPRSQMVLIETDSQTNNLRLYTASHVFVITDIQSAIHVSPVIATIIITPSGRPIIVPVKFESDSNFYMATRRSSQFAFGSTVYLSETKNFRLIFSNSVSEEKLFKEKRNLFFYSDGVRTYYGEPIRVNQNSSGKKLFTEHTFFAPYAKLETSFNPINKQINFDNPKVALSNAFQEQNLVAENPASQPANFAPILNQNNKFLPQSNQKNALLLSSSGTDVVPSLSKTSNFTMTPLSKIALPFGGNEQSLKKISDEVRNYQTTGLGFRNFFHPYGDDFITQLNQKGLSGILECDTDAFYNQGDTLFKSTYLPTNLVQSPFPQVEIDFDEFGAYSQYNYELFFHAPLYIATRLSRNGKFAEAMQWFHSIFDPTTSEPPDSSNPNARYWKVQPFRDEPKINLEEYLRKLQTGTEEERREITRKMEEWREHPFNPHVIARGRSIAYMKNVVMKYLENLLAWGDDLFRRDTIESINEATQIYIIAAHILGKRPEFIPRRGETRAETYATTQSKLDAFSNAMVQMENIFPFSSDFNITAAVGGNPASLLGIGRTLYFCIPNNEKLLGYWDKVADRLFKIRHCQNIEGVERHLALFEPPIDPALLTQAAAAGLNIGSVLNDLNTPAPIYRFNFLLQKSLEIVAEVKSLGNSLLSAIEKGDNEAMTRLRTSHERQLLELITSLKEKQLVESRVNRQSLEISRESANRRLTHYKGLLGGSIGQVPSVPEIPSDVNVDTQLPPETIIPPIAMDVDVSLIDNGESGLKLIPKEKLELDLSNTAKVFQVSASAGEALAGILNLFPVVKGHIQPLGVGASTSFGGPQLGAATSALARVAQTLGLIYSLEAAQASKMASYIRREQEWVMQADMAAREIVGLDKQIIAAKIREQIAQKDLDNHHQQIRNAEEVEHFLQNKFSREELYQWMKEQLVIIYKQSYQLASDMAKQAEKAYRFELGKSVSNFIQNNYWNNTFEGLTAGEKLHLALKQMEKSYLEDSRRSFELTKHVSLAMLDPEAVLELKQNGKCEFNLPEELFDVDNPGHYSRRIQSVSLSIPCVAGPHTSISATLRLLKNSVRVNTLMNESGEYKRNQEDGQPADDPRFVEYNVPFKAIATSSSQNDSGVFELNFRDERYLPFEKAGAISTWKLEMPDKVRQFDYSTITDVIMHLRYTAGDGGSTLRTKAEDGLKERLLQNGYVRIFSLKHDFPQAFHQLTQPPAGSENRPVEFSITDAHLPYFLAQDDLGIREFRTYLQAKEPNNRVANRDYTIAVNNVETLGWSNFGKNMIMASVETNGEEGQWRLKRTHIIKLNSGRLPNNVDDVLLMFVIGQVAEPL